MTAGLELEKGVGVERGVGACGRGHVHGRGVA